MRYRIDLLMEPLVLRDNWLVRPLDTFHQGQYPPPNHAEWLPIAVPGHWQQHPALKQHTGKVVYHCQFSLDKHIFANTYGSQRMWLRFQGVFYHTHPYINGVDLGNHEGYFEPYEQEVTSALRKDNTLLVEVACDQERNPFAKHMIMGVFSHWDCLDPQANPGGIWLPVTLHSSGPVRAKSVRCHNETYNERFAQLRYAVEVDAIAACSVVLRWRIIPQTFVDEEQVIEQRHTLRSGWQQVHGMLKIRDPRLWWTHDLGNPDLYTIALDIVCDGKVSDTISFDFGVRRFELQNWIPHLNGVRFLVKGSNYPPGDMRIATMTSERYERDMQLVRECHMNLLRVHGHVEHPAFYRAANVAGILLWQDMPLQWLYHAKILPEARRQAKAMVHLLYNHPSVVVWCMHNKPIRIQDINEQTLLTRLRAYNTVFGFNWNRDVLDTQLKRLAEQEDPSRPVVRSSGEFYVPGLRSGTDTHLYFGWYPSYGTLRDAEILRKIAVGNWRFVTEFGAQSFPNVESCITFMAEDIPQIDFNHLAKHHGFQPEVLSYWVHWRECRSLEELVAKTQDYQIFINRFYIDRLRYLKYRPTGGIVPFLFCDAYPSISWSIVDYWRLPKRSYYAMRMAFCPQYVFTLIYPKIYRVAEPIDLPIYVVNDAQYVFEEVSLTARLYTPQKHTLANVQQTITLEADCLAREVDRLRLTPDVPGCYMLELELTGVAYDVWHVYEIDVEQ